MLDAHWIQSSARTMAESGGYRNWQEVYAELNHAQNMDKGTLAIIFSVEIYQRFIDSICACAVTKPQYEWPAKTIQEGEPTPPNAIKQTAHRRCAK